MTPLLGYTRTVFVAGVCLTAGTGVGFYVLPDQRIARDPARDLLSRGVAPVLVPGARGYR
jgi:hypothetical protein